VKHRGKQPNASHRKHFAPQREGDALAAATCRMWGGGGGAGRKLPKASPPLKSAGVDRKEAASTRQNLLG
jgi:hypothetical protein